MPCGRLGRWRSFYLDHFKRLSLEEVLPVSQECGGVVAQSDEHGRRAVVDDQHVAVIPLRCPTNELAVEGVAERAVGVDDSFCFHNPAI